MISELRYTATLGAPALFSTIEADPNLVRGTDYIPGSAVWGALAGQVIQTRKTAEPHRDPLFVRWFLRDGLRCLNAYPRAQLAEGDKQAQRLLPTPLSIQRVKTEPESLHDLAAYLLQNKVCKEQTKRLSGYVSVKGDTLCHLTPRMQMAYHTDRGNRLSGRASAEEGALFVYEALSPGQEFEGRLLGAPDDLSQLCDVLKWSSEQPLFLRMGRSRSAQYGGGVRLDLLMEKPQEATREISALQAPAGNGLVVTLISPLILADKLGNPAVMLPPDLLAAHLNLAPGDLAPAGSFVARTLVGGFSSAWLLPRPQWPAFAAGSVFLFQVRETKSQELRQHLLEAEAQGLGQRQGEGFGRFALNGHGSSLTIARQEPYVSPRAEPIGDAPAAAQATLKRVIVAEILRHAQQAGLSVAGSFDQRALRAVSPALLGRVQLLVREMKEPAMGWTHLESFRAPGREGLERLRQQGKQGKNLWSILKGALNPPPEAHVGRLYTLLPSLASEAHLADVARRIGYEFDSDAALYTDVVRRYLLALLGQLSRERRIPPAPLVEGEEEQ